METSRIMLCIGGLFLRMCLLLAFAAIFSHTVSAQSEFDVKAAYLNNFAKMVTWPSTAYADAKSPFVIGIVGRDSFGGLGGILRGQNASGHPIEVRSVSAEDEDAMKACHLIYVSAPTKLNAVSRAVQGRPVLIIGDEPGAARSGAMIGFTIKQQRVKLEINNDAARNAKLRIPSDILDMATLVKQP